MKINPAIFKAYDIRGIYPEELNEETAYAIGQAYVQFVKPKKVVVGRDVRASGQALQKSLIDALTDAGVNVDDIGMTTADMLYFAMGKYGYDGGIIVSASHNPKEYNGLNMSRGGAVPISSDTGLFEIRDIAQNLQGRKQLAKTKGTVAQKNYWDQYSDYVLSYINPKNIKPLKIVANANFGMQTKILQYIVDKAKLPLEIIPLNAEPNGSFPKGSPNPMLEENRREICELVKKTGANLGVAWDADGDRCFFVDELGNFIEGYFTTAILASEILKKHPESKIIIDPRLIWASIDLIKQNGGIPIINRAGKTLIAERMKKENAVFAGEMSAHYYFRDNFYRDNGMIPLFLTIEMMSKYGKKLSEFYLPIMNKYFISGEINSEVKSISEILAKAENKYSDGKIEHIDGVSIEYDQWRFNLRGSNTEPKIRLNVESYNKKMMEEKRDELLKLIRN